MTARDPAYAIGQQVLRRGGRIMLNRQADLHITGAEHIPASGPALLVARHYHHLLDGCALYQSTARPLHILVGLDWAGTGSLRRVMERLSRMVGWPVILRPDALDREQAAPARRAEARRLLREATRDSAALLAAGKLLVVFPEGYPVVDPHADHPRPDPEGLLPFQPGVTRLLRVAERRLEREIPVLPVGFAYERDGDDDRWRIAMRVGAPVDRACLASDADLTTALERRVAELSGVEAGSPAP